MVDSEKFKKTVRAVEEMLTSERDEEEILRYLRGAGFSIIESMRVMIKSCGHSLAEAKQVVHNSETWADGREGNERFHENLIRALEGDDVTNGKS
ncbi:hypothetical protein [Actinophytocola sediminis]